MMISLRCLSLAEMDQAAVIHRTSFDARLPWLAGLHTPDEDRAFYRMHVFKTCQVWGALQDGSLAGFIAFREGGVDQLYVLPGQQRRGMGRALRRVAMTTSPRLDLWTFQRNIQARRFYESHGFAVIQETDGSRNEEREPDVLYRWSRAKPPE